MLQMTAKDKSDGRAQPKSSATLGKRFDSFNLTDLRILLYIAMIGLLLFLPELGSWGILDPSEGYYTEAAREMVVSGDYLTPQLYFKPWFEKPILSYWLMAAAYNSFGISEFAARLASALSAIVLSLSTFAFMRPIIGRRASVFAALALLTTPYFLALGHLSLTDMPFSTCLSVALLAVASTICGGSRLSPVIGYLAAGLAVLAKGPLALVAIMGISGSYMAINCHTKESALTMLKKFRPLLGIFILGLVILPWYVGVSLATNGGFIQEFFLEQNVGRVAGTANHQNYQPWYYLPYLFGGGFPWIFFLSGCLPSLLCLGKRKVVQSKTRSMAQFALIWAASLFILFSILPTKLPTYILPIMPALAVLTGIFLNAALRRAYRTAFNWTKYMFGATALAAACIIGYLALKGQAFGLALLPVLPIVSVTFLAYCYCIQRRKLYAGLSVLFAGITAIAVLAIPIVMRTHYERQQLGFHELLKAAGQYRNHLGIVGPSSPSSCFYLGDVVPLIKSKADLKNYLGERSLSPKAKNWLFLVDGDEKDLRSWTKLKMRKLSRSGKWTLIELRS